MAKDARYTIDVNPERFHTRVTVAIIKRRAVAFVFVWISYFVFLPSITSLRHPLLSPAHIPGATR